MATLKSSKIVKTITHEEASRKNIPTAEYQAMIENEDQSPMRVAYERRNPDLDPQLVWRGKDEQDWSDLVVQAPALFIQEKVHPKVADRRPAAAQQRGGTLRLTTSSISSPTSTACRTTAPAPSSTATTPTGRTG